MFWFVDDDDDVLALLVVMIVGTVEWVGTVMEEGGREVLVGRGSSSSAWDRSLTP